jgi:hypothetical protein
LKHTNPEAAALSANELDLGSLEKPPLTLNAPNRFFGKPVLFIYKNGFRLQRGRRDSAVLFADTRILRWKESDSYTNGICTGTEYDILLDSRSAKVSLKHVSKIDPPDEFPFFAQKLVQSLADTAQTQIKAGGSLQGRSWNLTAEGLEADGKKLNWSEIADADLIENQITVWKSQESYPFLRIPVETAQARVLLEILERYVKKNPVPGASGSLGRFLFRRKAASPFQLFLSLASLRKTYDFYENGIIQRPEHHVFFFKNCESLQYQVTLQFINGIYAFTRTVLTLKSLPDQKSMQIRTQRFGNDKELEQAKLNISKTIADRLYLKVATEQEVAWGKFVRISKDEIHYLSTGFLGGSVNLSFPFSQPLSYSIDSGKFYLFRAGEQQPLFTLDCDEENFYPGFFLMLRLASEH